jgi:hypothetical protein
MFGEMERFSAAMAELSFQLNQHSRSQFYLEKKTKQTSEILFQYKT